MDPKDIDLGVHIFHFKCIHICLLENNYINKNKLPEKEDAISAAILKRLKKNQ